MMERGKNFEGHEFAGLEVVEPHFNDERTIQTARRVVPLNPLLRTLTKRRVALIGAFVLSALLGAGSALAIIHLRQPVQMNLSEAAGTEEADQPVAEAKATDLNPSPDESVTSDNDLDSTDSGITPPRSTTRPRRAIKLTQQTPESMPKVTISIQTNDSQRQARLVDEWQERRQRRVVRPERPNYHHKRDLFRIREIFEGPRRY